MKKLGKIWAVGLACGIVGLVVGFAAGEWYVKRQITNAVSEIAESFSQAVTEIMPGVEPQVDPAADGALLPAPQSDITANTARRFDRADMKSNLRDLSVAQAGYFADHDRYAATIAQLGMSLLEGVTIVINAADADGWNATAHHANQPFICAISIGTGESINPELPEGSAECDG